jgi:hypothetical protein
MAGFWYAVRSKPRKEDILSRQLRAQGFEVFYPRVRVHRVNPRARKLEPYFPGYMFVQADWGTPACPVSSGCRIPWAWSHLAASLPPCQTT